MLSILLKLVVNLILNHIYCQYGISRKRNWIKFIKTILISIPFLKMSTTAGFSTFTPSYQNIANRMSRLKHHKSTQSLTQIRPNSARKIDLNVFVVDTCERSGYEPRRRLSPTNLKIQNQTLSSTANNFTGRVAKNTGIKKYNQRHLRELADGKNLPFTVCT